MAREIEVALAWWLRRQIYGVEANSNLVERERNYMIAILDGWLSRQGLRQAIGGEK